MRIAVTSQGNGFDDQVDPRFGRCAYFLIVETETMDVEPIKNSNVALGGGAGIQSAQLMSRTDVKVVLTGNCGPNAYQTLNAAGIEVIVGVYGKVRDVVEQYKSGSFSSIQAPNVVSHFGMGTGAAPTTTDGTQFRGQQMGMGQSIGSGRGIGRGMGRGMGLGQGIPPEGFQHRQDSVGQAWQEGGVMSAPEQELNALKDQAQAMKQQLQAVNEKIARIESGSVSRYLIAVVNAKKCNACGLCVEVCPVAAIKIDNVAIIDRAICTGCERCIAECPQEAITLKKA
ncbi:MAG: 4Fe-4S binding protein [Deltaproteobacteria bacterium]|nr:4Fe-4S binding protein [Deltaproteobacteria bacterium]